jgi:hypothetical protein
MHQKKLGPGAGNAEGPKISSAETERDLPTPTPKCSPRSEEDRILAERFFRSRLVGVLQDLHGGDAQRRVYAEEMLKSLTAAAATTECSDANRARRVGCEMT